MADDLSMFIETSVSRRIDRVIGFARRLHEPAVVTGRPGIGKTWALRNAERRGNQAWIENRGAVGCGLILCSEATRQPRPFLNEMADAAGVGHWDRNNGFSELVNRVCENLIDLVRRDFFMLVDEAQFLNADTMRLALHFNDVAKLPIVFVGNNEVLGKLKGTSPAMLQITDRISIYEELETYTEGDVIEIGMKYLVTGKDAFDALINWSAGKSLRKVNKLLERAREFVGAGEPILAAQLLDAMPMMERPF